MGWERDCAWKDEFGMGTGLCMERRIWDGNGIVQGKMNLGWERDCAGKDDFRMRTENVQGKVLWG